jgi:catechol 2,3-dioxygenase-like lactoylglutathione lyase family enzyme
MGMLQTIDHVNVVVRDLDAATEFFVRLGFGVEDRARLSGAWISDIVGLKDVQAEYVKLSLHGKDPRLELIRYDAPESDGETGGGEAHDPGIRHLAFRVENIDAVIADLEGDVKFFSPVQTYAKTGKRLVYFRGPEGILLELAEYP